MAKLIDLTDQTFERLTVISRAGTYVSPDGMSKVALWLCRCECNKEVVVLGRNLRSGLTRSCGCLRRETSALQHPRRKSNHT